MMSGEAVIEPIASHVIGMAPTAVGRRIQTQATAVMMANRTWHLRDAPRHEAAPGSKHVARPLSTTSTAIACKEATRQKRIAKLLNTSVGALGLGRKVGCTA